MAASPWWDTAYLSHLGRGPGRRVEPQGDAHPGGDLRPARAAAIGAVCAYAILTTAAVAAPAPGVRLRGTLRVFHADVLPAGSVHRYAVEGDDGSLTEVRFREAPPAAVSGARVDLTAAPAGRRTAPLDATGWSLLEPAPRGEPVLGERGVLVVVLEPGRPGPVVTTEDAREAVFTGDRSAAAFYAEASGSRVTLGGIEEASGDVAGPYPASDNRDCDPWHWSAEGRAAARADGYDVDRYHHRVYVVSGHPSCGFIGMGEVGGGDSWVIGDPRAGVVAHELGHNLGLGHADGLECSAGGSRAPVDGSCRSVPYADPFSVMGLGAGAEMDLDHPRHFHAQQKQLLGWLEPGQARSVTDDEVVPLHGDTTLLITVPGEETDHLIEYRRPLGAFDDFDEADPVATGLSVRLAPHRSLPTTHLVDATPTTRGFRDAPLPRGDVLDDPLRGVRVLWRTTPEPAAVITFPPTRPARLRETGRGEEGVSLSWDASADNVGVAAYVVRRDGVEIGRTEVEHHVDEGWVPGSVSTYTVEALDGAGNASVPSAPLVVDNEAPSVPARLRARAVDIGSVALRWDPAHDRSGVAGYVVYRDGQAIVTVEGTDHTDTGLRPNTVYRYRVAALDRSGNTSPLSRVARVRTPLACASYAERAVCA